MPEASTDKALANALNTAMGGVERMHALGRDDTPVVTGFTGTHLRDVNDHLAHLADGVEPCARWRTTSAACVRP